MCSKGGHGARVPVTPLKNEADKSKEEQERF